MIAALIIAAWSFIALKFRKSSKLKQKVARLFRRKQPDILDKCPPEE
jgi:hypothetical protein